MIEISKALVDSTIPVRPRECHKLHFGRILLICGSVGYTGAARMAAEAALRSGAGLTHVGTPRSVYPIVAGGLPEAMVQPLVDDADGKLSLEAADWILQTLDKSDCCLVGPGLGRSSDITGLINAVLERAKCPVVLDADGINAIAGTNPEHRCELVLTPHGGEYERLGGGRPEETAERLNCTLVLKGARTAVYSPDGRRFEYFGMNPGMARGGSGDVLAGLLTSLIGQAHTMPENWKGADTARICAAGVWLHGEAGKRCAVDIGQYGMLPTDVIARLPELLRPYNCEIG